MLTKKERLMLKRDKEHTRMWEERANKVLERLGVLKRLGSHSGESRSAIEAAVRTRRWIPKMQAHDVAFFLMECLSNMAEFMAFLESPKKFSPEQVDVMLGHFFVDVPKHFVAAYKLYQGDPMTDVFGVGAVKGTGRMTAALRARYYPKAKKRKRA